MFDINNFMHSFRHQIKTRWGGDSFHAYAIDETFEEYKDGLERFANDMGTDPTEWGEADWEELLQWLREWADPCLYATDYEPLGTYGEDMDDLAGMNDPESFGIFRNDAPIFHLVFLAWEACLIEITGELVHELKESVKN